MIDARIEYYLARAVEADRSASMAKTQSERLTLEDLAAVLGWTAPNGIAMCQSEFVERLNQRSRPWSRLPA